MSGEKGVVLLLAPMKQAKALLGKAEGTLESTRTGMRDAMRRAIFLVLLAGCSIVFSGSNNAPLNTDSKESGVHITPVEPKDQDRLTIRGVRLTKGGAVHCPQILADDGRIYAVSYLAPSIAVGDRIEVTGFMAYITTCLGQVLYAEEVRVLGH